MPKKRTGEGSHASKLMIVGEAPESKKKYKVVHLLGRLVVCLMLSYLSLMLVGVRSMSRT